MASAEGVRSFQGASDELYDALCWPCHTDKIKVQATHYCKECREYLCTSCKDYHRKRAVTKNHSILSANKIPATASISQGFDFVTYCGCNKYYEVAFYCEDHRDVICDPCNNLKHRNCRITDVQTKLSNYTTATFNSVLTKAKLLTHKFENMHTQRKSDSKTLQNLTEECKTEIKRFRATIHMVLDKLEQSILQELFDFENIHRQHIDQQIAALTERLEMLDSDHKLLEDARSYDNKIKMFIIEEDVSEHLRKHEAILDEIKTDASKPALNFVGNQRLIDLQTEISCLGQLKEKDTSFGFGSKAELKSKGKVLLGKKATSQEPYVRASDDENAPLISGSAFMSSGHAVLCDSLNYKVKLLDKALVLRESLKLVSRPGDVSVVDDNNVVITLPDTKQLQYIQVFPRLKTGRVIQLDKKCRGIEVFGDEMYITLYDDPRQGEVQVLNLNGNIRRKLQTRANLHSPDYITVSKSGKIFVSAGELAIATITCMTADGNVVYQYTHKELVAPSGMYVDAEDNMLICDHHSDTVLLLTANGKKYGTLLSSSDGLGGPCSIAYRETDDTLLVGRDEKDHAFIYKLK